MKCRKMILNIPMFSKSMIFVKNDECWNTHRNVGIKMIPQIF